MYLTTPEIVIVAWDVFVKSEGVANRPNHLNLLLVSTFDLVKYLTQSKVFTRKNKQLSEQLGMIPTG